MPDSVSTCQVTKITIGKHYLASLMAAKPLVLSFPQANPTHQFILDLDPDVLTMLNDVVPPHKPTRTPKVRKKKSR